MKLPSREEIVEGLMFLGLVWISLGAAFGIGVQLTKFFRWGCG